MDSELGFLIGIFILNVGLTVDAVGTLKEHETLIDILNDFNIESTFFIRGKYYINMVFGNKLHS